MSRSKPKIRHLAIMTLDPERLAKFYEQTFEMKRLTGKRVPGSKAVYMTDGYITLALLENKADGKPSGLNHFGWAVDDQDEINGRLAKAGIEQVVAPDGQIHAQAELKREELVVADLDIDRATQAMFKFDTEGCAQMLFADTVAPHEYADALRHS